jgi:hypothetical protein
VFKESLSLFHIFVSLAQGVVKAHCKNSLFLNTKTRRSFACSRKKNLKYYLLKNRIYDYFVIDMSGCGGARAIGDTVHVGSL